MHACSENTTYNFILLTVYQIVPFKGIFRLYFRLIFFEYWCSYINCLPKHNFYVKSKSNFLIVTKTKKNINPILKVIHYKMKLDS